MEIPATLSAAEGAAVREFMAAVRAALGQELRQARLFGSRARGEGHQHSDLDIALIVGPEGRRRRHALYDLAFDVGLRYGLELSPLVIEESRYQELVDRERLIARDIAVEGIPL